jgi:hypothetical protein
MNEYEWNWMNTNWNVWIRIKLNEYELNWMNTKWMNMNEIQWIRMKLIEYELKWMNIQWHLTTYNAWSYIYIYICLSGRWHHFALCLYHCGWVFFTNCSPPGLDTTQSIGITCKLFLDVITFSVSFITEGQIG